MNEEVRNEEIVEKETVNNEIVETETFDEPEVIPAEEESDGLSKGAVAAVVVVGGLALYGARKLVKDVIVPGAKKAGGAIVSKIPFDIKKKPKVRKNKKGNVEVEVEAEEVDFDEVFEEDFEDEETPSK